MNTDKIVTEPQETQASSTPNVIRRKHHVHTASKPRPTSPDRMSTTMPHSPTTTTTSSAKPPATQPKQPQQTLLVRGTPATSAIHAAEGKKSSSTQVEKALSAEEKEFERLLKGEEQDNEQLLPLPQSTPPHTESPHTHPLLLELSAMQEHLSNTRSSLLSQLDQYPLLMTSLTPPAALVTPLPVHHPTSRLIGAKTDDYALKLRPRSHSTIHNDASHSIPIARMGDYQTFLRQHPWLRDPFEDAPDFNAFGSPYKLRPKSPTPVTANTTATAPPASTATATAAVSLPVADIPAVNVEDKQVDAAVEHVDEVADVMDATPKKHQIYLQQGWQQRKGMSIQNGNKRPNLFEWLENRKKEQKQQQQIAEAVATSTSSSTTVRGEVDAVPIPGMS